MREGRSIKRGRGDEVEGRGGGDGEGCWTGATRGGEGGVETRGTGTEGGCRRARSERTGASPRRDQTLIGMGNRMVFENRLIRLVVHPVIGLIAV